MVFGTNRGVVQWWSTQTSRSHGVLLTAVMPWPAMPGWWRFAGGRGTGRRGLCLQSERGLGLAAKTVGASHWSSRHRRQQGVHVLRRRLHPVLLRLTGRMGTSAGRVPAGGPVVAKTATSPSLARAPCRAPRDEPGACCLDFAKAMVRSLPTTAAPCCFTTLKMTCCVWSAERWPHDHGSPCRTTGSSRPPHCWWLSLESQGGWDGKRN